MDYQRNNLDKASSPYLKQHQDNPVWWQEWNADVVAHARKDNKPIFVSVGYSTCHWCHVMADEVFASPEAAAVLNRDFVSIKVDREQRPDIDRFLIALSFAATGTSGWPLNAFLTPDLRAITALTYIPLRPRHGMPGFIDILSRIKSAYEQKADAFQHFELPLYSSEQLKGEIDPILLDTFDLEHGGTPGAPKFPPHSLLIFSLYYLAAFPNPRLRDAVETTLDIMLSRGLHDHLQGGFFRYCVDKDWTIPHFEKMLYDQALLLWAYALAFQLTKKPAYGECCERLIKCLEESFASGTLFFTGHDADTRHREGDVYLWEENELLAILGKAEYETFKSVYTIIPEGNYEGKHHLVKLSRLPIGHIETKLLNNRKTRPQPFVDRKILTDLNCLTGIAYIHAGRALERKDYSQKAVAILTELLKRHFKNDALCHSSFDGVAQKEQYLQDYASLLLFITYLHEETGGGYADHLQVFYDKLLNFKTDSLWIESENPDFLTIPSETIDYSHPASASLAELALIRAETLLDVPASPRDFHEPLTNSFLNISTLISNGLFHLIRSPQPLPWAEIPINSIQLTNNELMVCYKGSCKKRLP